MSVLRGSAVFRGLLTVLGGLGPVGLGLEAVQGCLFPLFARGVAARRSSIAGVDQVGAVAGAQVTITSTPVPIDASPAAVGRSFLDGDRPGDDITQVRRPVPCPGRGVTVISSHIPRHRPGKDLVDLYVPLPIAPVPPVGDGVPMIGGAVTAIRGSVPLVTQPITLVRGVLPLGHPIVALRHVRLRTLTRSPQSALASPPLARPYVPRMGDIAPG